MGQFHIGADLFTLFNKPLNTAAKVRSIYKILVEEKYFRETGKIQFFWNEQLNKVVNFQQIWKVCKTTFVDGYTRDIHFLLVQKALGTRSRLSNFVPG